MIRRTAVVIVSVLVAGLLSACDQGPTGPEPPDTAAARAEFGRPATPDTSKVTLQPAVVVVGDGRNAVWAIRSSGFDVVLDSAAPGVSKLHEGSVLLATSYVMGKVAKVTRHGDRTEVLLAPAQLTDVIKDGTIAASTTIDPADLTLQDALHADPAASVPGPAPTPSSAEPTRGVGIAPASFLRPSPGVRGQTGALNYSLDADSSGISMSVGTKPGGLLKLTVEMKLLFSKVAVASSTTIKDGKVTAASATTSGIKGLSVGLGAGSAAQGGATSGLKLAMPFATTKLPVPVAGIPFYLQLKPNILVSFALAGKNSTITANATWSFDQSIQASTAGAAPSPPSGFRVVKSLMDSISGIALAGAVVTVGVELKFVLGLGIPVVGAGAYGKGSYTVGVGMGSALGSPIAVCRKGTVEIKGGLGAGIDVDLPSSIKDVLNRTSIGRLLGGVNDVPLYEKMWTAYKREQTIPQKAICGAG